MGGDLHCNAEAAMREFRTGYVSAPCRADWLGKPSYVQCRVNVTMPPSSARTGEAMLHPFSDCPTYTARFGRVSGVNKHHGQPKSLCLVTYKVLELSESPSMQSCPNSLSGPDAGANIGKVFKAYFTHPDTDSFSNDGFTNFVVRMFHMSLLTPGDCLELAFSSPTTVGLETTTMGKVDVAIVPQLTAAPYLAGAGSCEIVFTNVNSNYTVTSNGRSIWNVKNKIEIPDALTNENFSFFWRATFEKASLVLSANKGNLDTTIKSEQRQHAAIYRVSSPIKSDGCWPERKCWNWRIPKNATVGFECLVCVCDSVYSLTSHLATNIWIFFSNMLVDKVVQGNPVPAAMLLDCWYSGIAGIGKLYRQRAKGRSLTNVCQQFQGNRTFHIGQVTRIVPQSQRHNFHVRVDGRLLLGMM